MPPKSKNQLRRERQKLKKLEPAEIPKPVLVKSKPKLVSSTVEAPESSSIPFETELDRLLERPEFADFKKVFDRFHTEDEPEEQVAKGELIESDDEVEALDLIEAPTMSKKKLRRANKIALSTLKTKAKYPSLVEWYDADAQDPLLVVELKCLKNSVQVPVNWQFKRDYLAGKRGFEKRPFTLPKFLADTGITDMRDTTKEDDSTMKQRQRERVQPKMNRLDMDYQKLHDAFFKFQTKPRLYGFGELFYEGKDMEEYDAKVLRPGVVSDDLREALGVPKGGVIPWVAKMTQYGPPPSYPFMKIPGFNAPTDAVDRPMATLGDVEMEPFGKMLSYESEEESEEDGEEEEEEEEGGEGPKYEDSDEEAPVVEQLEPVATQQAQEEDEEEEDGDQYHEDVPLADVQMESRVPEHQEIEPKKLYQILKEKVKAKEGFMSTSHSYELGDKRSGGDTEAEAPDKKPKIDGGDSTNKDEDEDEDEDVGKFKF